MKHLTINAVTHRAAQEIVETELVKQGLAKPIEIVIDRIVPINYHENDKVAAYQSNVPRYTMLTTFDVWFAIDRMDYDGG